jgi:hypothetical protein
MKFDGFVGSAYTADSRLADAQSLINLYVESDESSSASHPRYLRQTPGLTLALTLPTSPIRGMWSGGGRLFVAAGSKLYEVFSNNTYNLRGDISTDSANDPVQMFPNGAGTQLVIISGGRAWVDNGTSIVPALFPNRYGNVSVDVTGLVVTWLSGTQFDASMVGGTITINSGTYTVTSYTSATVIGIDAGNPASPAGNVPYSMVLAVAGTATTNGTTTVTWASGLQFDDSMVGQTFNFNGSNYLISAFTDATHIVVNATIATHAAAAFSISNPVYALQGAFLDAAFIVSPAFSKQMFSSGIDDGTSWDPLDNASKQAYADNIAALLADHEELYVAGTETTEVWRTNAASTSFACQRDPAAFIHHGCVAPWSFVRLGEGVAWLAGDLRGWTVAYQAVGYVPQRISTHNVETEWKTYTTTADAIAFVYREDGHEFWCIHFPSGNATWVYDLAEKEWHRRGYWNGSSWDRQRQAYHTFVFGLHMVGDYANGNIYVQSQTAYTDNGTAIYRQRASPHVNLEHQWTFYSQFELLTETGNSVTVTLDWSDDGGVTWHTGKTANSTASDQRYAWRRLGKSRDRVFRITLTTSGPQSIVDAYLRFGKGSA